MLLVAILGGVMFTDVLDRRDSPGRIVRDALTQLRRSVRLNER